MKRLLMLLPAVLMLLSLAACGGNTGPSEGGKPGPSKGTVHTPPEPEFIEEKSPMEDVLPGQWYLLPTDQKTPQTLSVSADGKTVTLDGKDYTWKREYGNEDGMGIWLLDGETHAYYLDISQGPGRSIPGVSLFTVRKVGDRYEGDEWCGSFVNHPMLPYLLSNWRKMEQAEGAPSSFSINEFSFWQDSQELKWSEASREEGKYTIRVDDTYTVSVELRGEYPILSLTDASGAVSTYCAEQWGYDQTWPEYIYPLAVEYLNDCLGDCSFWSGVNGEYYRDDEALKYVYGLFEQLGDYRDSAQYLERFTVLKGMYTGGTIYRVNNLGDKSESSFERVKYDEMGRVIENSVHENGRLYNAKGITLEYSYDEAGRISSIRRSKVSSTPAIITPVYDDQNRMVSALCQFNTAAFEFTYSYDDAGRLIASHMCDERGWEWGIDYTMTYDDAGRLLQEMNVNAYGNEIETTDYQYGENGHLVSKTVAFKYVDPRTGEPTSIDAHTNTTYTYANDEQGRPVSAQVVSKKGPDGIQSYASQEIIFTYEDLYFLQ